ncbi:hypothetical protein [Oscillibacter sp.]|uniref:hypothetical protein n=1 Tax=Oscillibacter sp. TaxID=1945593 RepID=UPI00289D67F1|nr:hypothetical protein [Oscillibacter sp.]
MEGLEVKVAEIDQRSKSNTHRLDDLEGKYDVLNRLATAVEVLATKQDSMEKSINALTGKVDTLENVPRKRWEGMVEKIIYLIVAGVVGFMLARAGL